MKNKEKLKDQFFQHQFEQPSLTVSLHYSTNDQSVVRVAYVSQIQCALLRLHLCSGKDWPGEN